MTSSNCRQMSQPVLHHTCMYVPGIVRPVRGAIPYVPHAVLSVCLCAYDS